MEINTCTCFIEAVGGDGKAAGPVDDGGGDGTVEVAAGVEVLGCENEMTDEGAFCC